MFDHRDSFYSAYGGQDSDSASGERKMIRIRDIIKPLRAPRIISVRVLSPRFSGKAADKSELTTFFIIESLKGQYF